MPNCAYLPTLTVIPKGCTTKWKIRKGVGGLKSGTLSTTFFVRRSIIVKPLSVMTWSPSSRRSSKSLSWVICVSLVLPVQSLEIKEKAPNGVIPTIAWQCHTVKKQPEVIISITTVVMLIIAPGYFLCARRWRPLYKKNSVQSIITLVLKATEVESPLMRGLKTVPKLYTHGWQCSQWQKTYQP